MATESFQTCQTCHHPFPVFVPGITVELCPPCRKRKKGERLTKSDLSLDAIHEFYKRREHMWRNQVADAEDRGNRTEALEERIVWLEQHLAIARRTILRLRQEIDIEVLHTLNFPTGMTLPDGLSIRDLVKLCHPDRWNDTEFENKAKTATQWLLTQR